MAKIPIPMRLGPKCRHCKDTIPPGAWCPVCQAPLEGQCSACHAELAHGTIKVQNTNTTGGRRYTDSRRQAFNRRKAIDTRRKGL